MVTRSRRAVDVLERRQLLSAAVTFATHFVTPLAGPSTDLVAGRFGGLATVADGVAFRTGGTVTAYGLAPDGTLAVVGAVAFDPLSVPQTVVAGDLNGDGLDDLVLVSTRDGYPGLAPYTADGTGGGFTGNPIPATLLGLDAYAPSYAGRRAAYLPAGTADGGAARVVVFGSTFAGVYGQTTATENQLSTARPAFDFVDAGGTPVLGSESLHQTFQSPSVVALASTAVVAGDFDGDGNADVAAVDASTGGIDYQLGSSTDPTTIRHLPAGVTDLATADVNGDGRADLIGWGDPAAPDAVVIWYGHADGTLTAGPTLTLSGPVTALAPADFNGDGHVDLATNLGVLTGGGDGTFAAPVALPDGVSVGTDLVAADVNGDGRPDLVAVSADGTHLDVVANTTAYAVAAPTVARVTTSGPVPAGSPIRLTASVSAAAGAPTGTVTFLDGTTSLGTAAVAADGTATLVVTTLAIGPHTISARYGGDAIFAPAVSDSAIAHVQRPVTLAYYGPFQHFDLQFTREGVSSGIYYYSISVLLVNADGSPLNPPDTSVPRGAVDVSFGTAVDASDATRATQSVDGAAYDTSVSDIPLNDFGGTYGQYMPGGTYPLTATFAGDDVYAPATLSGINVTIPSAGGGSSADPPAAPQPVFVRQTTLSPTPGPSPTPTLTTTGSIAGTVFIDANANAVDDVVNLSTNAREAGLGLQVVYLDENDNGRREDGEPTTTTAADGTFTFAGVPVGPAYAVRLIVPAGYTATLPAAGATWVTPTAVDPAATVLIGVALAGTAPPVPPDPAAVADPFGTNAAVPTVAPLTATVLSAGPASAGHPASAVTDSDASTYYDATDADAPPLVLDLGPTVPFVTDLTFVPREGYGNRMVGGVFECSSSPTFASDVTVAYVVGAAPPDGQRSAVYQHYAKRYWRYTGPNGGHGDIAEFTLYSNTAEVPAPTPTPIATPTPTATPGLAPSVLSSRVPAAVVAGTPAGGVLRLTLADTTDAAVHGPHLLHVYAVPTGADAGVLVGTVRRRVTLAPGKTTDAAIRVRLPRTLTAGTYTLLATTDDGHTAAGPTVTVALPLARLTATVRSTPVRSAAIVSVAVGNTGNVIAAGPVTVAVTLTRTDGVTAAATARRPAAVRLHGRPVVVRLRVPVGAGVWTATTTASVPGSDPVTATGAAVTIA